MKKEHSVRQRCELCLIWAVLAAITVFMAYMNGLTPLFADDFSYSVSFVTKAPFSSFSEVLASQYLHYFSTNGRTVVHVLAQVLLWIGKPLLNWFNAAAFSALCFLISYHAVGRVSEVRAWHLVAVFGLLWFFTPHFGGSYLWVMGAANYLYSPLLILLYLVRYRRLFRDHCEDQNNKDATLAGTFVWLLAGVGAGWTNENTSLALICMVLAVIALRLAFRQKVWNWIWAGLAGNIMGSMLLFLSPAQAKRLSAAGGFGGLGKWIERFLSITKFAITHFYWIGILVLAAGVLYWISRKEETLAVRLKRLRATGIYCVGALVSMYSMVGSPEFPVWAWSSILVFILTAAFSLFTLVKKRMDRFFPVLQTGICVLTVICTVFSFMGVQPELLRVKQAYAQREGLIAQAAQSGEGLAVAPIHTDCTYSSYSLFRELNPDPNTWPNNAVANYYGIASICAQIENQQ